MLDVILSVLMCEEPPNFQHVVEVVEREHVFMDGSIASHLGGSDECYVLEEGEDILAKSIEVVGICGWYDELGVDLYLAANFTTTILELEGFPNVEIRPVNSNRTRVSCRQNDKNGYYS